MGEDYPDHTYLSSYKAAGQQASSTPPQNFSPLSLLHPNPEHCVDGT